MGDQNCQEEQNFISAKKLKTILITHTLKINKNIQYHLKKLNK